jgi:hypothetical protein
MNQPIALKFNTKSKLTTFAMLAILLMLPVFLFEIGAYMYPADESFRYVLAGFGIFVGGGTILVMRKTFAGGLRFSPAYVLDNKGIILPTGKVLHWSNFEKAVVFFITKRERHVGFKFNVGKHDFSADEPEFDISSKLVSNWTGFPFSFPLDAFTEPGEKILDFISRKLTIETISEPIQMDEKAFERTLHKDFFKL